MGKSSQPAYTVHLRTVYIVTGSVAGAVLLISLIVIVVTMLCRKDSSGAYKSTSVWESGRDYCQRSKIKFVFHDRLLKIKIIHLAFKSSCRVDLFFATDIFLILYTIVLFLKFLLLLNYFFIRCYHNDHSSIDVLF